jgi:hypothetical protein
VELERSLGWVGVRYCTRYRPIHVLRGNEYLDPRDGRFPPVVVEEVLGDVLYHRPPKKLTVAFPVPWKYTSDGLLKGTGIGVFSVRGVLHVAVVLPIVTVTLPVVCVTRMKVYGKLGPAAGVVVTARVASPHSSNVGPGYGWRWLAIVFVGLRELVVAEEYGVGVVRGSPQCRLHPVLVLYDTSPPAVEGVTGGT